MVNNTLCGIEHSGLTLSCKDVNQHSLASPPGMNHSITNVFNLPIELKQKIALRLSSKNYASLRESCLTMSQDIDSFSILNNKMALITDTHEYKKKIRHILLNQSVRMIIKNHDPEFTHHVLKSVYIDTTMRPNGGLFITTVFSTREKKKPSEIDITNYYPSWIIKGFLLFKNELANFIENPRMISFRRKKNKMILWKIGVKFKNEFICYSQLKNIFNRLSYIFNQTEGIEKLLIAVIADELKSFWCKNIPHGLVKNDISESSKEAADLFTIAAEVRCTLQEIV